MNDKKKFISNLLVAFLSQGTSLIMSMLMTLILPKMLGVDQYSYSQLFIFYVGYVGLLHFGVNDGLYLRLGGKNIDDINNQRLGNEFRMFLLFECLVAIGIALLGLFIVSDYNRRFIVLAVAIAIVISNMTSFLGYLFQAVNETKWYSYSIMIDRIFVIVFMLVLLVLHITAFEPFVISYVVSKGIALAYCICKGKNIVFVKASNYRLAVSDVWLDVCIGIKLTISNIVSMLILGFGRKIIDIIWGIASFGKISLSFSLTNFFLVFIQQISMVMFPALRRVTEHLQKEVYIILRAAINILAPAILILYIPMEYVLGLWLPQYKESLHYLGFLLPICIFDGKMQMLFTTYFKVFRQEKILMKINIASCIFSVITCTISGYVIESMMAVVASMVSAIVFRAIVSDFYLTSQFGVSIGKEIILEVILVFLYIWIISSLDAYRSFLGVLLIYSGYLLMNIKNIKMLLTFAKRQL